MKPAAILLLSLTLIFGAAWLWVEGIDNNR